METIIQILARELGRNETHVENVINLIDALCTKGAKHVKVKRNIALHPFADSNSLGFALTF